MYSRLLESVPGSSWRWVCPREFGGRRVALRPNLVRKCLEVQMRRSGDHSLSASLTYLGPCMRVVHLYNIGLYRVHFSAECSNFASLRCVFWRAMAAPKSEKGKSPYPEIVCVRPTRGMTI